MGFQNMLVLKTRKSLFSHPTNKFDISPSPYKFLEIRYFLIVLIHIPHKPSAFSSQSLPQNNLHSTESLLAVLCQFSSQSYSYALPCALQLLFPYQYLSAHQVWDQYTKIFEFFEQQKLDCLGQEVVKIPSIPNKTYSHTLSFVMNVEASSFCYFSNPRFV